MSDNFDSCENHPVMTFEEMCEVNRIQRINKIVALQLKAANDCSFDHFVNRSPLFLVHSAPAEYESALV